MFGEQIHLQVPPKLFWVNSWIPQMIRQWISECWSGDRNCMIPNGAMANSRNWQLMTFSRSQMRATRNFRAVYKDYVQAVYSLCSMCLCDDICVAFSITFDFAGFSLHHSAPADSNSLTTTVLGSRFLSLSLKFIYFMWLIITDSHIWPALCC